MFTLILNFEFQMTLQTEDLMPCFSPKSYISGDIQTLTLTAVLIPHPYANTFCAAANGYSSSLTIQFYDTIVDNLVSIDTITSGSFNYHATQTNYIVFSIATAQLLYKILAQQAISYTAQLSMTSTTGVFQTPQFTQINSTSCWNNFQLNISATKNSEFLSVEVEPNFCDFPNTATDFVVKLVINTTIEIEIKPKLAPGLDEFFSFAYLDYVGYHHTQTKRFHQICSELVNTTQKANCYMITQNMTKFADLRIYMQVSFTYLGLNQIIRSDITTFTTPTTQACITSLSPMVNVMNFKNFAFQYNELTNLGGCYAVSDYVLMDLKLFIADGSIIYLHRNITITQLMQNNFQLFELSTGDFNQQLQQSLNYQLQLTYYLNSDIVVSHIIQNTPTQTCLEIKNLYVGTSGSVKFENAPINKASCRAVQLQKSVRMQFIVVENGIDVIYGVFEKVVDLDFLINMSQIEFTCESDIGDTDTDIKGTCKDRLKLYKDKIVTGKQVAFTFSVPTKFDYSEYTYSEDYTLIYVAIGSYCGGLALFGTLFLLILVYKTKQKDE
ncbi:Conserved_hypothetical protein [Hexamita inflata]|uniref:Uncharacterized protein n=1 Tax=Hexamita inflata TaxID=28002 RepID=A0AA86R4X1_9EUKA|nr:Conserved hypothetical protein [Hexamita inflata]